MKIDETVISIIKHLRDGRNSFRNISLEIGISENTVRDKVNEMIQEKIIDISGRFDPDASPSYHLIFMGINVQSMKLMDKAEELSRLRGVIFSAVVTGRFDILMQVLLNDQFGLLDFYVNELNRINGIQSIETFVVYRGFNLKVPLVC